MRNSARSFVVRGDVHAITLPRPRGRVQHGRRFAVIVQADDLLALSTIVVCPTSTWTPPASFHPEVVIGDEPTRVMCELAGAVDARALGEQIEHLTLDEIRSVDDALQLVLDLR
jgi:mRNA-degrading endonuclease toxin of MazEF toxin-antitoxin module